MELTRREHTFYAGNEGAVSEVIGSVMLISIVVIAVSIVGVVLWSQPPPEKIPVLSAGIANQSCKVILTHNGGNVLEQQFFKIFVDTDDRTFQFTKTSTPGAWTSWGIGEMLVYDPAPPCIQTPQYVRIVYTGGNGALILSSASFVGSATFLPTSTSTPIPPHTITATAGSGGTISPSGTVSVSDGASQAFTITADAGYHIVDVFVDGVSQGPVPAYTFVNVVADHTIAATFAVTTHIITATAGAGGTIAPSGAVTVNEGASQTLTITANTGYHIADVLVDGSSVGVVATYTFTNVVADHTISATFAINTYTITPSAGPGGSISPSSPVTVNYGGSQTFTITRNTKYHIADVLVDGSSVGAVASYTFVNVVADHTIAASFAPNTPQVIFYDNFESAFSGWTAGGLPNPPTPDWYTGSPKNGTYSIQLKRTESITRTISTAGYSGISVSFALGANSLDNVNEYVIAEWSPDGSTWNTMQRISDGQEDNQLHAFTFSAPSTADYNPAFALRFRIQGSSHANDYGFVDDVQVTGIPD